MGNAQDHMVQQNMRNLVQSANFTEKDLKRLYKRFLAIDTNKNGELDHHELLSIPEISDNPLGERVIAVLDSNRDGKISFTELLVGLARLTAGISEEEKLKFAFDIFDVNRDGLISNGELFAVMKMMVGDNLNDHQLQQLVDRTIMDADLNFDGMIDLMEFKVVVSHIEIGDKLNIDV